MDLKVVNAHVSEFEQDVIVEFIHSFFFFSTKNFIFTSVCSIVTL